MKKIKNTYFLIFITLSLLTLMACNGENANGDDAVDASGDVSAINIASVPNDSGWYVYISEIANIINNEHDDINLSIQETGGTVANATEMANGNVEVGFIESFVAHEAYNGIGRFEDLHNPDMRLFALSAPTVMHWAVTEESGITTFEELEGVEFNPSSVGGGGEYITEHVFEAIGVQPDYHRAQLSDAADLVRNNQLAGFSYNGNPPIPAFQEVHTARPLNILSLTEEQLEVVLEELPFLMDRKIEAETYDGIDEAQSVGLYTGIALDKSLDEELVYKMIKTYYENLDQISEVFPQMDDSQIEDTLDNSTVPLHPGVVKYFEEEGYEVPDNLIPPENE